MSQSTAAQAVQAVQYDDSDLLAESVTQTHAVLHARMSSAERSRPTRDKPREPQSAADPFLAGTARHLAAVHDVLLPAVRRHATDGGRLVRAFAHQSRQLERALSDLKARLYGSALASRRPWTELWSAVATELAATRAMEFQLIEALGAATSAEQRAQLLGRLRRSERRGPTRPHPYLPHLGTAGRMARKVARRVDGFLDTAEGRMVPAVRPRRPAS